MKKNIMHLLYSSDYGGAEKVVMDMIDSNADSNNFIYVSTDGGIREYLEEKGIKSILLKNINYFNVKRIVKNNKINIIHAHDFKASLLASCFHKKCKIISHIHQSPKWLSNKTIKTKIYKSRMKMMDTIFVTSEEIKENFAYSRISSEMIVLPNIVNVPKSERKSEFDYDFLFVGRLENEKRPDIFIEYINLINEKYKLNKAALVGKGSLYDNLIEMKKKSDVDIELLGFQKNPYEIMARSKFLLVTSEKEGFGLAIIESMQQGVPVITRRIGGVTEILDDSNSVIIDNFNEIDYLIIELLNNKQKYNEMSKQAILFSNKYRDRSDLNLMLKEVYEYDC